MPQGRGRRDRRRRKRTRGAAGGVGLTLSVPARRAESPRLAVHDLAISLARHPDVVEFARALLREYPARDRVGRLAALFTFVGHLVDCPPAEDGRPRDGVDVFLMLAGEQEGPAVILAALLQAVGERASVVYAPGIAFVRVEVEPDDLRRLPPFAGVFVSRGRYYVPLDARSSRSPLGFLPRPAREAILRLPRAR